MNNPADQDKSTSNNEDTAQTAVPSENSRRRFTRNALAGGTVMLSLGNRSVWGQDMLDDCLSKPTWDSWVAGGDMFASLHPEDTSQAEKDLLAQNIRKKGPMDVEVQGMEYVCPTPEPGEQKSKRQKSMKRTMRDMLQ